MALYTPRVLTDSLKKLMGTKMVDTITVKELTEDCNMNRKTFYYHFHSIVDLLKWMFVTEICAALDGNCTYATWKTGFGSVMQYLADNEIIMQNVCESGYWNEIRAYLSLQSERSMKVFVEDSLSILEKEKDMKYTISDSNMIYIIKAYSMLKFALIEEWFMKGRKESIDDFLIMFGKLLNNNIFTAFRLLAEQKSLDISDCQ